MTIEIGDVLTRRTEGLEYIGERYLDYPATVIKLEKKTITCSVRVDNVRTMVFDAKTGIHEYGLDYGWLVEVMANK